jgi:hypothetical protein
VKANRNPELIAKLGPASRVRLPALLAGLASLLFAMLLVLWGLSRAADRQAVWQVAKPIAAGEVVPADALVSIGVSSDRDGGLVPVSDVSLVGQIATHDLAVGELLVRSDVTDRPKLNDGEKAVGAVLRPGKVPGDLRRGDVVVLAELSSATANGPNVITARVVELSAVATAAQVAGGGPGLRQGIEVVLAVPQDNAVLVAQWAANDRLVVVREIRS